MPCDGRFLLVEEDVRGQILLKPAGRDTSIPARESVSAAVRETPRRLATGGPDPHVLVQQWPNPRLDRQFVRFTFAAEPVLHHPERPLDAGILRTHARRSQIGAGAPAQPHGPGQY